MRENFVREIEHLLDAVPAEQWADRTLCGIVFDFFPWHNSSSVTLQTRDDQPYEFAAWKYYPSAEGNCPLLHAEIAEYESNPTWQTHHKLLIEAAEALLTIEFTRFGHHGILEDDFCLNPTFRAQVDDPDEYYLFNFCEFVLARRMYPLS